MSGGSIDWVTYYFRDRLLAAELVRARRRGVAVKLTLEARPRTVHANQQVIRTLSGPEGIGQGLRLIDHPKFMTRRGYGVGPRLHQKIYCFSHPEPVAFVGSFNPSGDFPEEDPDVIREIGDQDRGHNLLVEIASAPVVEHLVAHARRLHASRGSLFWRLLPRSNQAIRCEDLTLHFWPRLRPDPIVGLLRRASRGSRVRVVTSHLIGGTATRDLIAPARRGADVEILVDATPRRVHSRVPQRLKAAGIRVQRVVDPDGLPMHNKFVLIEEPHQRGVAFGSRNWTRSSRWLNHEISVISQDQGLFDAFTKRWEVLQTLT